MKSVKAALDETTYRNWFENKIDLTVEDNFLTIAVGSPFLLSWMQRHFSGVLKDAARESLGHPVQLRFVVDGKLAAVSSNQSAQKLKVENNSVSGGRPALRQAVNQAPPARRHQRAQRKFADFADYVVGPCNEFAFTASLRLAGAPSDAPTPLFLHGGVGVGKTHLLEAVYRRVRGGHVGIQVAYMSAESFCNYFSEALRDRTMPAFRQRVRAADVLILDDVDFFEGKKSFQEELLHTLQSFEQRGRSVVLAADRHPRLFTKTSEELISRFLAGTVCRLQQPEYDTRLKILERKSARSPERLEPAVREFIAKRFRNNVRELEGALNCLDTYAAMTGRQINQTVARRVLAELERDCLRIVQVHDVERAVCEVFGIEVDSLRSSKRNRSISRPRMLAMYLARKHTEAAYAEIGEHFGGRNHSTVISAERKVHDWLTDGTKITVTEGSLPMGEVIETIEARLQAS
ncbi:chromosomal replication initiator protein DnaA [Calycomorphotria hydatis]|uniref:chromosomal replication initiator protein DnaA n=1 Tax=Calycomorphotria hydatis TaxID=2528027 RepID=UPI0018D237E9|nr:chromosomal replication initiator protein DnaA [Calycomorphotria hydatis]